MSIKDFVIKIKPYLSLLIFLLFLSTIVGALYIYRYSQTKTPINVGFNVFATSTTMKMIKSNGIVVGSKNGTKYYYPWCGALNRIKPENRVEFASVAIARAKGYTPAKNCKGVE